MQGSITEAILTIASIIAVTVVAVAFMQNMASLSAAQTAVASASESSILTSIKIIFATNCSSNVVKAWVKNVGASSIPPGYISSFNVFFGPKGKFDLIPYNRHTPPYWNYTIVTEIDNDGDLDPGETLEITIVIPYTLSEGDYFLRVVTHNGISYNYFFSIGGD